MSNSLLYWYNSGVPQIHTHGNVGPAGGHLEGLSDLRVQLEVGDGAPVLRGRLAR